MRKHEREILEWLSRSDYGTPTELGTQVMGATRDQSTVYACRVLKRMLAEGLVSKDTLRASRGSHIIQRYRITARGRELIEGGS